MVGKSLKWFLKISHSNMMSPDYLCYMAKGILQVLLRSLINWLWVNWNNYLGRPNQSHEPFKRQCFLSLVAEDVRDLKHKDSIHSAGFRMEGATSRDQRTASSFWGQNQQQPQELDSTNNLTDPGSRIFSRASKKEPCATLIWGL